MTEFMYTYLLRHAQVFFYSLGQLLRAPFSMLMTASVIGIALALPTGLHLILKNMQSLGGDLESTAQISLFLKMDTSTQQAKALLKRIQAMPQINKSRYVSSEQALADFKSSRRNTEAVDALNENPLPITLILEPSLSHRSTSAAEKLLQELKTEPLVDEAQLDLQWIERLFSIMAFVQRSVIILAALLALAVLLVVGNTIRLAIQNRRDEIVVIKLIGGTDAFIRRPFLYTGFWYGIFGGLIAIILVSLSLWLLNGPVKTLALSYESEFYLQGLGMLGILWLLAVSITLGLAGSWLAVGRHLRAIEPT